MMRDLRIPLAFAFALAVSGLNAGSANAGEPRPEALKAGRILLAVRMADAICRTDGYEVDLDKANEQFKKAAITDAEIVELLDKLQTEMRENIDRLGASAWCREVSKQLPDMVRAP